MSNKYPRLPAAPVASTEGTRASMKGNKSSGTGPEVRLAEVLNSRGLTNYTTNAAEIPGSPDFAFWDEKIAVFVHGCFWHRCPHCKPHFPKSNPEYWQAKFIRNRLRDAEARSALRSIGWKPLVVWECTLRKNPMRSGRRIERMLELARG